MLSDHERFSNGRPPGFVLPGAPAVSDEEMARSRAGNLLGLDPPEHQRLRRMLTPEFTIRRMKRLEPRIVEIVDQHLDAMESAGPPVDLVEQLRAADPVAGDLRVARRALRRPRRLPAAQRTPAGPLHSDRRTAWTCSGRVAPTCRPWSSVRAGIPATTFSGCWSASTAPSAPTTNSSASPACCCSPDTRPRRTCWASARWRYCGIPTNSPRSATIPTR